MVGDLDVYTLEFSHPGCGVGQKRAILYMFPRATARAKQVLLIEGEDF
jgi:hypothetical protein